jgi:Protein of unknown function (DUF2637)
VPLPQLRRVRWAVRATLLLGVAASVAANILHAEPNPVSQMIAAWPPLALLLTVELISRVPVHRRALAFVRLVATSAIAGIAAWVSYWHMAGVASRYGESGASPYLMPLSVDGLVIVASVSLVELAGRIRTAEEAPRGPATVPPPPVHREPVPAPVPAPPPAPQPVAAAPTQPAKRSQPRRTTPARHEDPQPPRPRRPVAETAALAARIEAERPDVTPAELAAQLGISTSRLRAIRREAKAALEPVLEPVLEAA